ncbi:MAG: hypothetical protein R2769_01630 [Saprospiraceae bacterium]
MNGAMTNPDFNVVCHAGAQVKNALDMTIKLGGANYVFWGGREGYMSLLNTDMKRELITWPSSYTRQRIMHVVKVSKAISSSSLSQWNRANISMILMRRPV